ncbi:hypothetical protein Csa_009051 [Cucumis sativus]|nr:hypothetical protein Csa_009051 [Cucumis sativus]
MVDEILNLESLNSSENCISCWFCRVLHRSIRFLPPLSLIVRLELPINPPQQLPMNRKICSFNKFSGRVHSVMYERRKIAKRGLSKNCKWIVMKFSLSSIISQVGYY